MESIVGKLENVEHYLDGVTRTLDRWCDSLDSRYPNLYTVFGIPLGLITTLLPVRRPRYQEASTQT